MQLVEPMFVSYCIMIITMPSTFASAHKMLSAVVTVSGDFFLFLFMLYI